MSGRLDHTRTRRLVLTGIWIDAAIVMAASAYNGGQAFAALGEPLAAGIALGVAVDVGLAVALVGDGTLHLERRSSSWGRALRITTAAMSLALNSAVAAWLGHWGVAAFHAFLPMLLIVLTESGRDYTLQFGDIADEHDAAQAAEQRARQAEADEAALVEREAREAERAAEDASREQAAELARADREHRERQLATLLALTPQLARRRQRATPARARTPRQTEAPAAKPTTHQAPDLADLVSRARPLVADGMGRTQLARQLGTTTHWARRAIDQIEAERPAGLHAVERSA